MFYIVLLVVTQDPTRKLLGLPIDFGPIFFYSVENGEERLLEPDTLLETVTTGLTARTSLLVKLCSSTDKFPPTNETHEQGMSITCVQFSFSKF
jgi:hypothetical protein